MNITKELTHKEELIKLAKIYRLVCVLEKHIFCEETFISVYKQITKLFKKDYKHLFLYKQEYESNTAVLNYCIRSLKNQFRFLQVRSYYYDLEVSLKSETYFITLKNKQNVQSNTKIDD